jgi:hypothetical protein
MSCAGQAAAAQRRLRSRRRHGGSSGGLEGGEAIGHVGGLAQAATTGLRAGEHIVSALKAVQA